MKSAIIASEAYFIMSQFPLLNGGKESLDSDQLLCIQDLFSLPSCLPLSIHLSLSVSLQKSVWSQRMVVHHCSNETALGI